NDLNIEAGTLTAGEWNDLKNWGFWQSLVQKQMYFEFQNYWQFFPTKRYSVKVTDNADNPVIDCDVQLLDKENEVLWQAKTNNSGTAELWAPFKEQNTTAKTIIIDYNGQSYKINQPETFLTGVNKFQLPGVSALPVNCADVMFIVDATGSMDDEINYLKKELEDVISQVLTSQPDLKLKIGSVFYRDKDDKYLTRSSPLSANTQKTLSFINEQSADGGGDYPEAVDAALSDAISQQNWSESARSRIAFLMLDAPPHHDSQSINNLKKIIKKAAQKGVKLIPIAASGMDKETEFLMRFFSVITNGTYLFITDHSGIGNGHIEPTVGDYRVEYLNDLLARVIIESTEPSTDLVE
ncbi:VWA domain-containing protein, partial [Aureispira]|nr:VWA domain-containing protein [Aureispira sp.]